MRTNNRVVNSRGTTVGVVEGTWFVKKLYANQFYRRIPGITYSMDVIREAMRKGAHDLRVLCRDTGTIYEASIETFFTQRNPRPFDHGLGIHFCLEYKHWTVVAPPGRQLAMFKEEVR